MRTTLSLAATLAALSLGSAPAYALAQRTFVSGTGTDSGTCGRAAPCRSLQFAHDQTTPNGEIAVLDTAGYGVLTITKAISIVNAGGVEAGITVPAGGNAISIAAGANDSISLRGLTLDGQDANSVSGIVISSAEQVQILDCVLRNFSTAIDIRASTALQYVIGNTVVQGGFRGIIVSPLAASTGVTGVMNRLTVTGATYGVSISATSLTGNAANYAAINDSVIAGNFSGLSVSTLANGARATAVVQHSTIANNTNSGIYHFVNGVGQTIPTSIRIGDTTIANNLKGIRFEHTATVSSLGNNMFTDNGVDLDGGTLVALTPK